MKDFNPRGPHGPRHAAEVLAYAEDLFQSTRPSRTSTFSRDLIRIGLSDFNPRGPHGPRRWSGSRPEGRTDFNPRGPHGPRPDGSVLMSSAYIFQSTRPSRTSTRSCQWIRKSYSQFQSTRPSRTSTANSHNYSPTLHSILIICTKSPYYPAQIKQCIPLISFISLPP